VAGLWLVYRWRDREPPYPYRLRAYDVARCPMPAVTANGISAAAPHQAWLADRPPAGALIMEPRNAGGVDVAKPPYRVPTLDEIRAIPWNGLNVASAFSGAGGSSTGYRIAGYRVLAAVEFVPAACETYEANMADRTRLLRRDVRGLDADELLEACGLAAGELDVLDGSPPCEPFSMAGRRERTWDQVREYSGQRQRSDDLFYEFARLVDGVRPRVFAAENVAGLARGRARGYFKRIMAALRACGYRVAARTLDAAWLGVPQFRQRIVIVGVREDLEGEPAFPTPLSYQYTVREAIADLLDGGDVLHGDYDRYWQPRDISDRPAPAVVAGSPSHWHVVGGAAVRMGSFGAKHRPPEVTDQPAPTVVAGDSTYWHVDQVVEGHDFREQTRSIDAPAATVRGTGARNGRKAGGPSGDLRFFRDTRGAKPGNGGRKDRIDEPAPALVPGHNATHYQIEEPGRTRGARARRDRADEPAPAIVAGAGNAGTPSGHYQIEEGAERVRRRFTIPELRRICGFPDDYVLTGSFSQQWERLGDAVPPPMAAAWATAIATGPLARGEGC
jgi:DNA (cytosine-5)-methyltransferase 1